MIISDNSPIELTPHTMIIVPPNSAFRIEVPSRRRPGAPSKIVDGRAQLRPSSASHRVVASDGGPDVVRICGFFEASYAFSSELFGRLTVPIVEHFGDGDHVDDRLKAALAERMGQEVGFGTMSASLLKQVIIALLWRLARTVLLSRSAFSARFTNVIGQSPMVVLRNRRMRKAAEELRSGKLTESGVRPYSVPG